ncbi:MAG: hypothetical protein QOF33_4477, partial [Thermomicrobiales bacterium]|nr:hypothetical protein [Thermomicrobiales bacterium]
GECPGGVRQGHRPGLPAPRQLVERELARSLQHQVAGLALRIGLLPQEVLSDE